MWTWNSGYTAVHEDEARAALDEFEASELGQKYPQLVKVWREAWDKFIPFLQFPLAARKIIYTTNSIESMNSELSKATCNQVGVCGCQDAVVDDL